MDIIVSSGLAFGLDYSVGKITRPVLQPYVQQYHTSAPAAISAAGFAAGSVIITQAVMGEDMRLGEAISAAIFASGAQIMLGGETYRKITAKWPWSYDYLASAYTAAGTAAGVTLYKMLY